MKGEKKRREISRLHEREIKKTAIKKNAINLQITLETDTEQYASIFKHRSVVYTVLRFTF